MIPPGAFFVSLRKGIKDHTEPSDLSENRKDGIRLIYLISLLFAGRDEEIEEMLES